MCRFLPLVLPLLLPQVAIVTKLYTKQETCENKHISSNPFSISPTTTPKMSGYLFA